MDGGFRSADLMDKSLRDGQVALWLTPAPGPGLTRFLDEGWNLLSARERRRLDGFRSDAAARRFLMGRVLARRVLGDCLGIAGQDVPIAIDPAGMPYVDRGCSSDPVFSLSHEGETGVLAIARRGRLGVDLVDLRRGEQVLNIARTWFPAVEQQEIDAADDPVAVAVTLWAQKEALAKARGGSINQELGAAVRGRRMQDEAPLALIHGRLSPDLLIAIACAAGPGDVPRVSCRVMGNGEAPPAVRWISVLQ